MDKQISLPTLTIQENIGQSEDKATAKKSASTQMIRILEVTHPLIWNKTCD